MEKGKFVKLPVEADVSDPLIYRFDAEESSEKRRYRHTRAVKDIEKRMKKVSEFTGGAFALAGKNRENIQFVALMRMFEKIGLWTHEDYTDMFWICADESVRSLETNKEKIKAGFDNQKDAMMKAKMGLRGKKGKGLFVPSGVKVKKQKVDA